MDRISFKSPNDYIMNCGIKGININLSHCSSVEKANPFFNSSSSRQEILNKTRKINEGFYILPANLHLPGWRVVNPSPEELINNLQYHKYLGQLSPSEGGARQLAHHLLVTHTTKMAQEFNGPTQQPVLFSFM